MDEILDGVFHWHSANGSGAASASSYFVADPAVVIDPIIPDEGLDALPGRPAEILLSSGHHLRDATAFAEHFDGIPIRALPGAVDHIGDRAEVMALAPGETIEGIITPLTVAVISEDEGAVHIARGPGALLVADGVTHTGEALGFFPDHLLGDDPDGVKRGLRHVYRHLLESWSFDALLFAHGEPIATGGTARLQAFVEAGAS